MLRENKTKRAARSAPEAITFLWEEGVFESWRNQKEIEAVLAKRGNNFPSNTLGMAMARAKFLVSRRNGAIKEYIQKMPYNNKSAEPRALRVKKSLFTGYDIHPRIKEVVGRKYENQHYAESVEAALKEVIKTVKDYVNARNGDAHLDGDRLMNRAFGFENQEPLIKFNEVESDEEKDEQRGILNLFKGIVGIRNRKAHENIVLNDPIRALEYLALASLLMHLLDEYIDD